MMKKLMWLVAVISIVITALAVQFMPDLVPMHYNMAGEIDRWGSRYENFIFPAIIVGMSLFWQVFIWFYEKKLRTADNDKERAEAESNGKVIKITAVATNIMFTIMQCFFLYGAYVEAASNATHAAIDIGKVSCILLGLFFIVLGNFMPKARKNSALGVRTTWSMYNDVTWMKSNRVGAVLFVVVGVLDIVTAFLVESDMATVLMLVYLMVMAVGITVYSYKVYKVEVDRNKL